MTAYIIEMNRVVIVMASNPRRIWMRSKFGFRGLHVGFELNGFSYANLGGDLDD